MLRARILAMLLALVPGLAAGQAPGVLHVKVVLVDAEQKPTPVPRHALLVSDNPATGLPRKIVTGVGGTVDIKLGPGLYTVESDQPVAFNGKAYQWTQMVEIAAGQDAALELTAENAEVEAATSTTTSTVAPLENDPSFLLPRWQDSVVALWTPTTRASGFVVDARGLVVTNQRVIGDATSVEVQFSPVLKVAARVLASDRARNVAVLRIDDKVAGSVKPVPLDCTPAARAPIADGQEIFTIGAPLRGQKGLTSGTASRVGSQAVLADFRLGVGSVGEPVFMDAGVVVGLTSVVDETDEATRADFRVVSLDNACKVLESAAKNLGDATRPSGTHLPVEPSRPSPLEALEEAAQNRAGGVAPYQLSSSDFDIALITPVLAYAAQKRSAHTRGGVPGGRTSALEAAIERERLLTDFSNWSEYVSDVPPVLLVRVTPKLAEGFWTMVARGAASTQGVSLPPFKRLKAPFSRLRAFCGDVEVTPIHAFRLEQRVSGNDVVHEGLYAFDPGALGPQCGSVRLAVYSEKAPQKGDTRVVDPKVLQQIWEDFAPHRAQA